MNAFKLSRTLLCSVLFFLFSNPINACDEASTTITSTTVNGDGSVTYVIDMCVEYLGLEGSPDGWSFNFFPGTVTVQSFAPASVTTGTGDLYTGSADDNILSYTTTELFPSNSSVMFCNTYTITVSAQPEMLIVDYNEGYGPTCEETITFVTCNASIDNTTVTGGTSVGVNDYELEFGGTINFNSTGTAPPAAGPDPAGIGYALFTCMPTTALNMPFSQDNIINDPCFFGASGNANETDTNDPASPFFGGEVWVLPTTLDDNCTGLTTPGCDFDFGVDTDGDGCIDFGEVIHITYLPEPLCDCTTPDCPAGGYPDPNTNFVDCEIFNPALTNTVFTTCHVVTSDAGGFLGIVQSVGGTGDPFCSDAVISSRTSELFAMSGGSCTGGAIPPTTPNGGNSTTLNPEWSGLTPNTDYVICITMSVGAGCDVGQVCVDYYGQPEPCGTCVMPDCPIGNVPTYDDRSYQTCATPASSTLPLTNCYAATADAGGFLGFANIIDDGSPFCFPGDIDLAWELTALGDCGNVIPNPVPNANGVGSGFNPEYTGLTPGGQYVLCVTYSTPFPFDCQLVEVCVDYYGQPCTAPNAVSVNGDASPCENATGEVYSVTAQPGVTYMWTVPAGATITAGAGTESITVDWGTTSGDVCVTVGNGCPPDVSDCFNVNLPPTPSCDDGDCTTDDSFNATTCLCENTPIPPPSCDDGDCTTDDSYNTATCLCENTPVTPPSCDDGDCTTDDIYNPATCLCENTPVPPPSCDDGDCTTDDVYNPTTCLCENTPVTPPSCDDGDCTTDDVYNAATCLCENTPIPPPSCDDGDCTTDDSYNTATCMCENTPVTPPSCDDGDCTTDDVYNPATCLCENTPITPPSCDDFDCTTNDVYNPATCLCENTPIPPPSCDDGDCTTDDSYNTATCLCENVPVAPPVCDDNDCTTDDTYNTATCQCEFTPIPPPVCDDNDCTTDDTYNAATCQCEFTPIPPPDCDDNDCQTADVYNTQTCQCENNPIAPGSCDDGDCTTDDVYNVVTCQCENTPIPPPDCDDNDCTTDDTYNTATCQCENTPITPPSCDDFDCTTDDVYNPATCLCENTPIPPPSCDDGDCTTDDSYNPATCQCENIPVAPPSCDDNDCTTDDVYNTNTCLCENTPITPPDCDDFDCTTNDVYNPATCLCENTPIPPPSCDDGDCTTDDSYNTNTCQCENIPVAPPSCDDNDCTTDDFYNPVTCLCENTPITPPVCDDNDCTTADTYNASTCQCEFTPVPPPDCDDNDCQTADVYNTQTCECENNPIAPGSCDDGDCTTDDSYNSVTCECENIPITPPSCDDGDCTTDDIYNTNTCQCENTPIAPPSCDDFDCTTDDFYNVNTCLCENTPIPPPSCDDGDCTTDDSYNTATCQCENIPVAPPSCDDGDCTTADVYNTQTCECENNPVQPGSCDDGDCTTEDVYNTTTCECENTPIPPPSCDDNDCTTDDSYNTNTCLCENTPIPPPDCDDNDCTTDDSYNTATCQCENEPITPLVCDDNDCATEDSYNTATCECEFTPITTATATLSGDATICAGETATLLLELTGTAPFTVIYQDQNGAETTLTNISDGETIFVTPTATTTYSLVSVTDAICEGTTAGSATVTVDQPLTPPNAFCVGSDENSVTFGWAHPTATDFTYTISVAGGMPSAPVTTADLTHTEAGLMPGDEVEISIIAVSNNACPDSEAATVICTANDCPPQTVSILNLDAEYCADDAPFTLTANVVGGTFSGSGVVPGTDTFDPSAAGTGPILITYEYTDPTTGCDYQGSASTEISQPLVAPTLECGTTATNSVEFTWTNTGATQYEFTYTTAATGTITQTVNETNYTVFSLMPGEVVTASVTAVGAAPCGNSAASNEVDCTAAPCPTVTPTIDNLDAEYCADAGSFTLQGSPTGGIFTGNGITMNEFDPSAAGMGMTEIFYTYTDPATGCTYETSQMTNISAPLSAPTVFCAATGIDFVTFEWSDTGATDYEITVTSTSNGTTTQTVTGLTYTENGLAVNEVVTISVVAVSNSVCANSAPAETMCTAQDCPPQTVTIDNLDAEYCGDAASITLQGTPAGGTFSGAGVSGNTFSPADVNATQTTILYTYIDPTTGCEYTTQMSVEILPPYGLPVVTCGDNTMNSVTFNWTDVGTDSYEITISVNNGAPTTFTTGDLFWTENNLNPSDEVEITVVAVATVPCTDGAPVSVTCAAEDCVPSQALISGEATVCGGESALLTFNFIGTGPFDVTYLTNNGSPVTLTNIFNGHTEAVAPTVSSNYTIQAATDSGNPGCTVTTAGTATVDVTTNITATATITSDFGGTAISCAGAADGSAEITNPTGGSAPYTYAWSDGQTGGTVSGLTAGSYEVTITDASGCSGTVGISLDEPPAMTAQFTGENPLCAGDANGWLQVTEVSGGAEPYLYSLNGGALQMQDSFPNLPAGIYEITTEDANGCTVTTEATVIDPAPLFLDLGRDTLVTSGTIFDIRALSNANEIDTLLWSPVGSLLTADNFGATLQVNNSLQISAELSDANGCTATDILQISVSKERFVYIPNAFSPNFDGINDFFVISGGVGVAGINRVSIFDRWGEPVYVNTELQLDSNENAFDGTFDGQMLNDQVLVYVVEILFTDGEIGIYKGDLTIVR